MTLDQLLDKLETTQIVNRVSDVEAAYQFKHTLTQETVYRSLLRAKRRETHGQVARTYEELYADRLDEYAPVLAQHYAEAGDDAKTLVYAMRAGDAAARISAHAEAVVFYSQALQIAKSASAPDPSPLSDLYLKLGRVYEVSGNYDAALQRYEEMESLARERGDRNMELGSLMARATVYAIPSIRSGSTEAEALSNRAMSLAQDLGDRPAEAKILWNLMLAYSRISLRYEQALNYGERSLAIAREMNLQEQLAYTLNDLSVIYVSTGQLERGKVANQEARQMWQAMNNLPMLSDNLGYKTMTHTAAAEYQEAVTSSLAHLELSRKISSLWGEAFSQAWVGTAYTELGFIDRAIAVMENAIQLGEKVFPPTLVMTRADLAMLLGRLGDLDRGINLARLAHDKAKVAFSVARSWSGGVLGRLLIARSDLDAAEAVIRESSAGIDVETIVPPFDASIVLALGELALARRADANAISISEAFVAKRRRLKLPSYLPTMMYLNARVHLAQGNLDQAARVLAQAHQLAEAQGARWSLWRILATLSEVQTRCGNANEARQARTAAHEQIDFIVKHTPVELRESFLGLPQVRAVMEI
jgi:tetratricopeptide (TPR) repeat protein